MFCAQNYTKVSIFANIHTTKIIYNSSPNRLKTTLKSNWEAFHNDSQPPRNKFCKNY